MNQSQNKAETDRAGDVAGSVRAFRCGHLKTDANSYQYGNRAAVCRACSQVYSRERYWRANPNCAKLSRRVFRCGHLKTDANSYRYENVSDSCRACSLRHSYDRWRRTHPNCGKPATHCKRGHLFDEKNTGITKHNGRRFCRICKAAGFRKPERIQKRSEYGRKRFQESMSGDLRTKRLKAKRDRYNRVGGAEMKEARILVALSKVPREFAGARRALYELNSAICKEANA